MPLPIPRGRSSDVHPALHRGTVVAAVPVPPLMLPGAVFYVSLVISLPQGPLLKGKRCVVLADGFYEWQQCSGGKQPYFIYFPQTKDDLVLSLFWCLSAELCPPAPSERPGDMNEKPLFTWRGTRGVGGDEAGKCRWEFPLEGISLLVPPNRGSPAEM